MLIAVYCIPQIQIYSVLSDKLHLLSIATIGITVMFSKLVSKIYFMLESVERAGSSSYHFGHCNWAAHYLIYYYFIIVVSRMERMHELAYKMFY